MQFIRQYLNRPFEPSDLRASLSLTALSESARSSSGFFGIRPFESCVWSRVWRELVAHPPGPWRSLSSLGQLLLFSRMNSYDYYESAIKESLGEPPFVLKITQKFVTSCVLGGLEWLGGGTRKNHEEDCLLIIAQELPMRTLEHVWRTPTRSPDDHCRSRYCSPERNRTPLGRQSTPSEEACLRQLDGR